MSDSKTLGASLHRAAGDVAVTEQFDNHDGYRPAATDLLAGRELTIVPADRPGAGVVSFGEDGSASWEPVSGEPAGSAGYEALAVREDIVAVVSRLSDRRSVFAVADLKGDRFLAVVTELADRPQGGVAEATAYVQGGIGKPIAAPFERSDDLVGKRILWRYSTTHAFEHIYLNPTNYCWHGVEGPEQWIADVDPCTTYRLAEDLYLFAWSETVVPFNGAVVIDLAKMESVGRFFGWDTERGHAAQIVVGARGALRNETSHQGL